MAYRINVGGFEDYDSPNYGVFTQAHQNLIEKYGSYSREYMKDLWKKEYGGTVITESINGYERWIAVEFASEADYFWFKLKLR